MRLTHREKTAEHTLKIHLLCSNGSVAPKELLSSDVLMRMRRDRQTDGSCVALVKTCFSTQSCEPNNTFVICVRRVVLCCVLPVNPVSLHFCELVFTPTPRATRDEENNGLLSRGN